MHMLSDEQVLMAYLYHRGLSADQAERRRQCVEFNAISRRAIESGDAATLRALVERVNANQVISQPTGAQPPPRAPWRALDGRHLPQAGPDACDDELSV